MVSRQYLKVVSSRQLYQQGVDGPNLNAMPATGIPDLSGVNVILPVRFDERKGGESFYDAVTRLGTSKALQQFLQHKTRAEYLIGSQERIAQRDNFQRLKLPISAECERPNTGVDKQAHGLRERSAL